MSDFKDFKKKLQERNPSELSSAFAAKSYEDTRFWKLPTPAAKENSTAIIRFLPQKDADKSSFFRYYHYSFFNKVTQQYYIENSLNTFGDNVLDPCGEENRRMWNLTPPQGCSSEYYKDICRERKRKTGYISNILVVQDKKNPDNEGKVFLFKFGIKILEMINLTAEGNADLGKEPFDPTSFDNGANFALTMHKDDTGFFQYSKSVFGNQSSIGDDELQESVYQRLYELDNVLEFKPYDQLKDRLNTVLGNTTTTVPVDDSQPDVDAPYIPPVNLITAPNEKVSPVTIKPTKDFLEDEDMAFLNDLLEN